MHKCKTTDIRHSFVFYMLAKLGNLPRRVENHETCRFDGRWHSVLHTCPIAAAEVVGPRWQASNLQAADFLNQHEWQVQEIQRSNFSTFKYHKWICTHGTQSPHLEVATIGRPVSKDLMEFMEFIIELWASLCATHWKQ